MAVPGQENKGLATGMTTETPLLAPQGPGLVFSQQKGTFSDGIPGARIEGVYDAMRPGTLPDRHAENFAGGRYEEVVLTKPTSFLRVYGGRAGQLGKDGTYVSIDPQVGGLQSSIDYGVNPAWGNTGEKISTIVVPAGSKVYAGPAANRGGTWVAGKIQVYIPPSVKVEIE